MKSGSRLRVVDEQAVNADMGLFPEEDSTNKQDDHFAAAAGLGQFGSILDLSRRCSIVHPCLHSWIHTEHSTHRRYCYCLHRTHVHSSLARL